MWKGSGVKCRCNLPPEIIDLVAFEVDLGFITKKIITCQILMQYLCGEDFGPKLKNYTGQAVLQLEMLSSVAKEEQEGASWYRCMSTI
jgi:hypothetical protein